MTEASRLQERDTMRTGVRWTRRLTWRGTFWVKWVIPPAYVCAWAVAAVDLYRRPEQVVYHNRQPVGPAGPDAWVLPALIAVVTSLVLFLIVRRLEHVTLEDDALLVSNWLRTIRVPFANLRLVRPGWSSQSSVVVEFATPTPLGRTITFFATGDRAEIVSTLTRLAAEARRLEREPAGTV